MQWDDQCTENGGINGAFVFRVFTYFDVFQTPENAFGDSYGSELSQAA